MGLETFDRTDLTALFPDLSREQTTRLREAAARVEAVRLPTDTGEWDWQPENLRKEPTNNIQLTILGTTLTLVNTSTDWLELALNVVREQRPSLTVTATVEVACWCDTDHNMHVVRSEERLVGTATTLTEAFGQAADTLVRWTNDSHDPNTHRAAAGLPNPRQP